MEPEDWDDGYSDDENAQNSPCPAADDYGFLIATHDSFGTSYSEDVAESDSSSDDDTSDRFDFDDPSFDSCHTIRSSKSSLKATCSVPFWFGDEDSFHIQRLFSIYEQYLGVDKQKKECIRADPPFVGRILRRQVRKEDSELFTTLDVIDVFLNEHVPMGVSMPLTKQVHTLTSWDSQTGLPRDIVAISKKTAKSVWKPLIASGVRGWLFCFPQYGSKVQFTYSSSKEELQMRYSNDQPFTYQQFLPKRVMEDDLNNMPCGSPGAGPPKFHF